MSERMMIGLPSGAGDTSWAWSKLYSVRDRIREIQIADGLPRRTTPFVRCWFPREEGIEGVPEIKYGQFQYGTILMFEETHGLSFQQGDRPTWAEIEKKGLVNLFIQPNHHLEAGEPLEAWLPDLPTHYHYPLFTTEEESKKADWLLERNVPKGVRTIGISCASYRGAEAWHAWTGDEWEEALKRLIAAEWFPILIGGWWDELTNDVFYRIDQKFPGQAACIVGQTSMGENIEILKRLDSYFGYSSGLNVIRTVLNRPAMALWPDFEGFTQNDLSRSWAPPHMQEWESGRYIARLWRPVDDVWPTLRRFLETCERERGRAPAPPCP